MVWSIVCAIVVVVSVSAAADNADLALFRLWVCRELVHHALYTYDGHGKHVAPCGDTPCPMQFPAYCTNQRTSGEGHT